MKRYYLWTTDNDGPHFLPQCNNWKDVKEKLEKEDPEKFLYIECWIAYESGGEEFHRQWKWTHKQAGFGKRSRTGWKFMMAPETPSIDNMR